jgi:NADPH:quinone reductase-like Zn-dependent oxidoreductase
MRATCLIEIGGGMNLVHQEVAKPKPGAGEVLVEVHAAGVTPGELGWYPTLHTKAGAPRQRAIPGHEFSGVISEIGAAVEGVRVGDEIYGMNDWFDDGATAEFCLTVPGSIAPKPRALSHAEAATIPIGALTAWQGLFDRAKLRPGERVLIQGGAGGVGIFAVQLARHRGAHVISTASAANFEFVRALGADEVWDYKTNYFDGGAAASFDVVFDAVGGITLERSWSLLKPNGRMVTVASGSEVNADEATKRAFLLVQPSRLQLLQISELLEAGQLRPVVDTEVSLAQASEAYREGFNKKRGVGKVVVTTMPN